MLLPLLGLRAIKFEESYRPEWKGAIVCESHRLCGARLSREPAARSMASQECRKSSWDNSQMTSSHLAQETSTCVAGGQANGQASRPGDQHAPSVARGAGNTGTQAVRSHRMAKRRAGRHPQEACGADARQRNFRPRMPDMAAGAPHCPSPSTPIQNCCREWSMLMTTLSKKPFRPNRNGRRAPCPLDHGVSGTATSAMPRSNQRPLQLISKPILALYDQRGPDTLYTILRIPSSSGMALR